MIEFIGINEPSKVPKYKQIIASIFTAIGNSTVKNHYKLASVNELLTEYNVSRVVPIDQSVPGTWQRGLSIGH